MNWRIQNENWRVQNTRARTIKIERAPRHVPTNTNLSIPLLTQGSTFWNMLLQTWTFVAAGICCKKFNCSKLFL